MQNLINQIINGTNTSTRLYVTNVTPEQAKDIQKAIKGVNNYKVFIIDTSKKVSYAYSSANFWQVKTLFIYCSNLSPCGGMKRIATEIKNKEKKEITGKNMDPSFVDSYNDNDLIGTNKTTADDNFDQSHPLYQKFKNLAQLRQTHESLKIGEHINRLQDEQKQIYAFSRVAQSDQIDYMAIFNFSTNQQSFTTSVGNLTYNKLAGDDANTFAQSGDQLQVTLAPLSYILVKSNEIVFQSLSIKIDSVKYLTVNEIDKLKDDSYNITDETLHEILPEAFAVVKETASRFKDNEQLKVKAEIQELAAQVSYEDLEPLFATAVKKAGTRIATMIALKVRLTSGLERNAAIDEFIAKALEDKNDLLVAEARSI